MKDINKKFIEQQLDDLLDTDRRFIKQLASLALAEPEGIPVEIKKHCDMIEKKKTEFLNFIEQIIAQEQSK